jgi:hypothetical protein
VAEVAWRQPVTFLLSHSVRVVPHAMGALPLVICRSGVRDVADAGVVLGAGDPAVCVSWFPHCGCDACDSGSADELDRLDEHIDAIVTGTFRRLSSRRREITVLHGHTWSATGVTGRQVERILADANGWDEVSGRPWTAL